MTPSRLFNALSLAASKATSSWEIVSPRVSARVKTASIYCLYIASLGFMASTRSRNVVPSSPMMDDPESLRRENGTKGWAEKSTAARRRVSSSLYSREAERISAPPPLGSRCRKFFSNPLSVPFTFQPAASKMEISLAAKMLDSVSLSLPLLNPRFADMRRTLTIAIAPSMAAGTFDRARPKASEIAIALR